MIVAIDTARFAAAGLEFIEDDAEAVFTLPAERPEDDPRVVKVAKVGDQLHFFEQRSSGHKKVLARLGLVAE